MSSAVADNGLRTNDLKSEESFGGEFAGYDSGEEEATEHGEVKDSRRELEKAERRALKNRKEQKGVRYLRVAVYLVVVVTAMVVSVGVYYYAKNQEEENFKQVFSINANKLAQAFLNSVYRKIIAAGGLSATITQYALTHELTFPFVTIDNWESVSVQTRVQADGMRVEWFPLVQEEERNQWEEYALTHKDWREAAYAREESYKIRQDNYFGLETYEIPTRPDQPPYTPYIYTPVFVEGEHFPIPTPRPNGTGPWAPRWQMSPVLPHEFLFNLDYLDLPQSAAAFKRVLETGMSVLSGTEAVVDPNNITWDENSIININSDFLRRGQFRHNQKGYYNGDPLTNLNYPVFDNFGPNRTIRGFIDMPILWRLSLQKVLPEGFDGFIAVFKNNFNQSFSYSINGPEVTYLGLKDFHGEKYDDMFQFQNVAEFIKANNGPEHETYDAVELDTEFGKYDFYVYPSQMLEDQYITNEPAIFAAIVACIFLFTLLVLVAFDCLVTRRQQVIMKKAVQNAAMVNTLFPEQVRDRLFEDEPKEQSKDRADWKTPTAPVESRAIAELYPASSVLLMDLAGFTKWSSTREPENVFELLETLYQSFDKIAKKRGVYKIETIGDCWVGVTGVPDPQDDHAPRMVKFAGACRGKMQELLVNKLAEKLGQDTKILALRVGIHSGPITGGILRGDRGRFQLFGDTINTASRMESNGVPGKIHISQQCADEMVRLGYKSWLEERKDKIVAKGKGELTTFWVNVRSTMTTSSSMSFTETNTYPESRDEDLPRRQPIDRMQPLAEHSVGFSAPSGIVPEYDAQAEV